MDIIKKPYNLLMEQIGYEPGNPKTLANTPQDMVAEMTAMGHPIPHLKEGNKVESEAYVGYPHMKNKPRKEGFVSGFLQSASGLPATPNKSVLNPNDVAYMHGQDIGEPFGIASMALPIAGMGVKKAINALTPLKTLNPSEMRFLHGTTPEGKQGILSSGKFDPHPPNWPSYSYGEIGADTTYATPASGWWLDKQKAASGRAKAYPNAVGVDIDPSAKIAHIKSVKDWEKFAKQMGFKNGDDLYRSLQAENLDSYNLAKNLTPEQYSQREMEAIQNWQHTQRDQKLGDFHYYGPEFYEEWINKIPTMQQEALKEQSILGPRAAVKQITDKGYHGIYVDKHGNQNFSINIPAEEQLAIFDQTKIKPNPDIGYNQGGLVFINDK